MLITALTVTDYKRVRKVAIAPDADRHLILIGGKNRQGKSSTLDALTAAFGGAKAIAADPVRHGAGAAAIHIELDGGALTIDRTVSPDGKTTLEVRDADGAVRRPQEVLDKLVGSRFLDPLAFLRLASKEQRSQLMRIIPGAERIDELNAKRERAFDRRREIGRDLDKARGELDRLPEVTVPPPIDVAALNAEAQAFGEQQRRGDGVGSAVRQAESAAASVLVQIEDLQRKLTELQAKVPELEAELRTRAAAVDAARQQLAEHAAAWQESAPRRAQIAADLARANEANRASFAAEAQNKRRVEAHAAVERLAADHQTCTTAIETVDQRKAEILGAATLPVEGLTIADEGIQLAGVPFSQASASEQLRVALAIAIAGSPGLHDVWIRDGALLDDEALEVVASHAAAAGKRVWIERVGTRDPGVIVIHDGQVVG